MYEDFEDLRDNCPAEIKAEIAMDLIHDDPLHLAEVWPAVEDGEFRLSLVQAVTDFWEKEIRSKGGKNVPEDGFAIEIVVDSYSDQDMGSSLYLELHAYCGTEGIGDLAWDVFEDDKIERRFASDMAAQVPLILEKTAPGAGLACEVEVTEVEEL